MACGLRHAGQAQADREDSADGARSSDQRAGTRVARHNQARADMHGKAKWHWQGRRLRPAHLCGWKGVVHPAAAWPDTSAASLRRGPISADQARIKADQASH